MQFSIITPSYQPGPWLALSVASVADQTGVKVEHLIQDACSDDGTQEWLPTDPRVRAVMEKDGGMYDAINRGLRRARGEFVAYLNCDEQYLPGTLARVARYFHEHPKVDVVFGDAILTDVEGRGLSYRRIVTPSRWHTRLEHLGTLSCAMFFRRRLVEEGHLFPAEYRAIGDAMFVWSLLNAGKQMVSLGKPLSVFTLTGSNLGQSAAGRAEEARWRAQAGAIGAVFRPFVIIQHRIRKALAGAYRQRDVDYAIYTRQSPDARVPQRATLGWHWPR